jgi:hypothetical protein
MNIHLSHTDIALIVVVALQVLGMAYLRSPRAKTLLFMLPLPFSIALIATGRGVDATHVAGMGGVWFFVWLVAFLHLRLHMHILVADLVALVFHTVLSLVLARVIPIDGSTERLCYIIFSAVIACIGLIVFLLPHSLETGHRSTLPVWIKTPLIVLLILPLVLAKEPLRGFMPSFPML